MEYSAEMLFSMIGDREHAVKRPKDESKDRRLRDLVDEAQLHGELIINNGDGEGYFKPDMNKPADAMDYSRYMRALESRAFRAFKKIREMRKSAGDINQMDMFDLIEQVQEV